MRGRSVSRCAVATVAIAFAVASPAVGQFSENGESSAVEQALAEGNELFHQASNTDNQAEAMELYRRALRRYEFAVYEGDVANGRLFYNIGNAYYRLGDLGSAMLYYRRAELLRPGDPNISNNISQIRSERNDVLPAPEASGLARSFLFWHISLSSQQKAIALTAAIALGCIAGGIFILRRKRWQLITGIVGGALALLFLGSITVDQLGLTAADQGVITDSEVIARKGDGTAYETAFVDPLHAATEFTVLERRGSWIRIRLTDGNTAWIPEEAATMIRPVTGEAP